MDRMTIGEIAKIAGVSKTTVSRVLNNKPDVDKATRDRILDLISTYNYQPNAFAKAISLQKSNHVGLIIPHNPEYVFSNPFYTDVMHGVSAEVDARGYYLLTCFAHADNYLNIYKQKRVDGFVLLSPGSFHKYMVDTLLAENVPFVSTAKISEEESMTFVDVDNYHGGELIMEHLVELGHRKIAFIGKPTLTSSLDRLRSYRDVLQRHNLPCCDMYTLITETSSIDSGYEATLQMMKLPDPPTAIFLANDVMAIGAVKAAKDHGLKVPEDVSIAGFDDILLARYNNPPLTTVRQPAYEKGVHAARILIRGLEKEDCPRSLTLDLSLVVRASTGPVRTV